MILLLSRNSRRSSSTIFMLLACFIVTTYDYATSASHDNERLVNHAARLALAASDFLWSRRKEWTHVSFSTRSDERELHSPLSVMLAPENVLSDWAWDKRTARTRKGTAHGCGKLLRLPCQ
jgi:hypothetical protein